MVQILCTHVYKWKNDTVETGPGMAGGVEGECGGCELNYDIFDIF
jgi:hypothetical protein